MKNKKQLTIIGLLFAILLIPTLATAFVLPSFEPATPYTNENITTYCSIGPEISYANLTLEWEIAKDGTLNKSGNIQPTPTNTTWTFQEQPDAQGGGGNNNCQLFNLNPRWCQDDGNYNTGSGGTNWDPGYFFNYTHPANINGTAAISQVLAVWYGPSSDFDKSVTNRTVPDSCFQQDPIQFDANYNINTRRLDVECYNGTGWEFVYNNVHLGSEITYVTEFNTFFEYPEQDSYEGNYSVDTILDTETQAGENWTLSCRVYNGTITDPWENATVTILAPCMPDWSCDGYDTCLINDTQYCNSVTDLNSCGNTYTGDYSEFNASSCDYCTPSWNCTGYGDPTCFPGDYSESYCNSTNDTNSCYATTGLSSDQYSGNFSEFPPEIGMCNYVSQPVGGGGGGGSFPEASPTTEEIEEETVEVVVIEAPSIWEQIKEFFRQLIDGRINVTIIQEIFEQYTGWALGGLAAIAAGIYGLWRRFFGKNKPKKRRK